ncbi:hypothetical protein GF360_01495 [candidate division WWE3 bacterium]|nr:hypothetical protein [candidate division WWE3 bacterium]
MSVGDAWQCLQAAGLAFDISARRGIALQGWLPSMWSRMTCAADTRQEALELLNAAKEALGM